MKFYFLLEIQRNYLTVQSYKCSRSKEEEKTNHLTNSKQMNSLELWNKAEIIHVKIFLEKNAK